MVSRYFILSGIPLSQITIINEIQNMISYLIENSDRMLDERMKNFLVDMNFPDWDIFEFITKKVGRRGPSKEECIGYYNDKLVFLIN